MNIIEQLEATTITFLKDQFRDTNVLNYQEVLDNIGNLIPQDQNKEMVRFPSIEDVKAVVCEGWMFF